MFKARGTKERLKNNQRKVLVSMVDRTWIRRGQKKTNIAKILKG